MSKTVSYLIVLEYVPKIFRSHIIQIYFFKHICEVTFNEIKVIFFFTLIIIIIIIIIIIA